MDKKLTIVAVGLVRHDGVIYVDGEVIADVPVKQAEALLQVGAARLADVEPTNDEPQADDAGGDATGAADVAAAADATDADAPPADEAGGDAAADTDKAPAKTGKAGKAATDKKAR